MKIYRADSVIWHQGDPSRFVIRLLEGELSIIGTTQEGEELVHRTVTAGEFLGEMSALDGAPHSATVVAATECRVEVLSLETFRHRLRTDPQLAEQLLHQQNHRLRYLSERRMEAAYRSIRSRLAAHLLRLFADSSPCLSRTHAELARELGTTRESITKALKQLVAAGAVRAGRGRLEIVDSQALEQVALET